MPKETLNYLGIRKIFEKNDNFRALRDFLINYTNIVYSDEPNGTDPVLSHVEVPKEAIPRFSNNGLLALIVNDASPREHLISRVLEVGHQSDIFFLYLHHKITIENVEMCLDAKKDYTYINRIISHVDLSIFADVDFCALEKKFIAVHDKPSEWDLPTLTAAFLFLSRLPYDESHLDIANMIIKVISSYSCNHDKDKVKCLLENFVNTHIHTSLSGNDLLEFLHSRPDFCLIIRSLSKEQFEKVFSTPQRSYSSMIDELIADISSGHTKRIGFAMKVFKEIFEKRISILNAWVAIEATIELDIYTDAIMKTCYPPANYSDFDDETLDEAHIAASDGKTQINEDRSFQLGDTPLH